MTANEMALIKLVELESDPNRGNMIILKEESEADRYFMMFVGDSEFAAIAKEKGLVEPKRPLTHDLYLRILDSVRIEFLRMEIHEMREDTYYASVVFSVDGKEHAIDCRPSDGVALALNRNIPILVRQDLFRRRLTQEQIKELEGLVKTVKF